MTIRTTKNLRKYEIHTIMNPSLKRDDLIYPELSYDIVGALFEVFKELGPGYKEQSYQRAVAKMFRHKELKFREQEPVTITFKDERIGINYLDFCVEEKVIVELKRGDYFSHHAIQQVNQYLKATGLKLALLACFTSSGVIIKRIVNNVE